MGSFKSLFSLKCPKCEEGRLFVSPVSKVGDLFEMRDNCGNCGQRYYLELGFYWGAMYMAYIINSALSFGLFFLGYFGFGWTLIQSFIFLTIVLIAISPYIFRLSRSVWLHVFVRRQKNVEQP